MPLMLAQGPLCSCLGAVESAGLLPELTEDTAQSGRGQDVSKGPTALCGCEISPRCRVSAHRNQQLKGSIAAAPVCSNSEEIL